MTPAVFHWENGRFARHWRAENAMRLHRLYTDLGHWIYLHLVKVLALVDNANPRKAHPVCVLRHYPQGCRRPPAQRAQNPMGFCVLGPLWDDCAAVSEAQQDHGLDWVLA